MKYYSIGEFADKIWEQQLKLLIIQRELKNKS